MLGIYNVRDRYVLRLEAVGHTILQLRILFLTKSYQNP
jgi:hypothetical protein